MRIQTTLRLAIAVLLLASTLRAAEPATRPVAPIIELRGDAPALGEQHAKALGDAVQAVSVFLDKAIGPDMRPLATRGAMAFESTLRPEHLAEIKALASSAKVAEADIMLANSFLDLSPMTACSSISVPSEASPDHVARFARNLDFPTFGIADKSSVVFVYHPADRFGFVSVSWPGLIGALSAMNEHGLALANMEITRPAGTMPKAMPYTLLYRTVLERCKTVDEAIALLKSTPRQTPNNLMLMDASGNRAVVELTPENVIVRTGKPGAAP
jgi:predicted choloylglycine hydrolase